MPIGWKTTRAYVNHTVEQLLMLISVLNPPKKFFFFFHLRVNWKPDHLNPTAKPTEHFGAFHGKHTDQRSHLAQTCGFPVFGLQDPSASAAAGLGAFAGPSRWVRRV